MYQGVDAVEIDRLPKKDNNMFASIYFCVFLIFGFMFILNLFVGVVVSTFDREHERLGKNHLLTEN